MSNRLTIVPTKFENKYSKEVSFGYRAFDDFMSVYDNMAESLPDDELEFLQLVVEDVNSNAAPLALKAALEFCKEHELGLTIDQTYYEYEQISHILDVGKVKINTGYLPKEIAIEILELLKKRIPQMLNKSGEIE